MRLAACTAFADGDIQEDGILAQLQGGLALCVRELFGFWQRPVLGARCHQLVALASPQSSTSWSQQFSRPSLVSICLLASSSLAMTPPAVSASADSGVAPGPQKHLRRLPSNVALYQLCDAAKNCLTDAWPKRKRRSSTWMSACTAASQTTSNLAFDNLAAGLRPDTTLQTVCRKVRKKRSGTPRARLFPAEERELPCSGKWDGVDRGEVQPKRKCDLSDCKFVGIEP